jgi:hypothetical protein
MQRYFPLEYGVRVKGTGEIHWRDLASVRQAAKALGLILKFCPEGSGISPMGKMGLMV